MKEKISSFFSSISGISGIASSYNICHSICLGVVALLSVMGIAVTGLPLMFLQAWAPYLWTVGIILLSITVYFYVKKKCISEKLIMANTGFILIGFPFLQTAILWIIGSSIVTGSVLWHLAEKRG